MKRIGQYLVATVTAAVALVAGYVGFVYTGGAVPMEHRFEAVLEGAVVPSGGSLVQIGRGGVGGFILAGPIRDGIGVFVLILAVLVVGSGMLYWWAANDRSGADRAGADRSGADGSR